MTHGRALLGAVLAGGASRRFGRDKSAEEIGGVSMIEHAWTTLQAVCGEAVVVSSRSATPTGPWVTIPDRREGAGPLAGIEAGLTHAMERGFSGLFVLACDLPLVRADLLNTLVSEWESSERARDDGSCIAAARGEEPGFEPLCAIYPTASLPAVTSLLDAGNRAAWRAFDTIGGRAVELPGVLEEGGSEGGMLNVNTPADAERARAFLEARSGKEGAEGSGGPPPDEPVTREGGRNE